MRRLATAALVGATVGAAVAAFQALAREEPDDVVVATAARAGARGALVGGVLALVIRRRG